MFTRLLGLFLCTACEDHPMGDAGGPTVWEALVGTGAGAPPGSPPGSPPEGTSVGSTTTDPVLQAFPCAEVVVQGVPPFTVEGTSVGQGDDSGPGCEYVPYGDLGIEDLGIAFVAPWADDWVFSLYRSATTPGISLYDGCGGSLLDCVARSAGDHPQVHAELAAGQTVVLFVEGASSFVLDIYPAAPLELDCADQLDQDLDRLPDCLDDDCAADPACAPACPDLVAAGAPARVEGTTLGRPNEYLPKCNLGYADEESSDVSIAFTAPADGTYVVQVQGIFATALLDGCTGRELWCDLYLNGPAVVELVAGQTVVAVIEETGHYPLSGPFTADFFALVSSESSCVDGLDDDLDGGADCADPDCDAGCPEDCFNGVDDDGDALVDCADSPCAAEPACLEDCGNGIDEDGDTELDCDDLDCELDPACPEVCADLIDDDGDGRVDCMDGACAGDASCAACPEASLVAPGTLSGSTVGRTDDRTPSCAYSQVVPTPDWAVAFTAPSDGRYRFEGSGDTTLVVTDGCHGPELACVNPLRSDELAVVALDLTAGQTVTAWIEAYPGDFTLDVTQVDPVETSCADGLDEDADQQTDCADPDCLSDPVCAEDCANDADDNGDWRIDCLDPVCAAESVCASVCPEDVLAGPLPIVVAGSMAGEGDDHEAPCGNGGPGGDHTWSFVAPAAGTYTFATYVGADTIDSILYVLDGCDGAPLACKDDAPLRDSDSLVEVELEAGQSVVVVVDDYGSRWGRTEYTLEVR